MIREQLEKSFIRQTLERVGAKEEKAFKTAIQRQDFKTRGFLQTIRHEVRNDNMLFFDIAGHQRAQDMKRLNNRPNHHQHPTYNRYLFGYYGYLSQQLMYGLTDEVKQQMIQSWENP